MIKLPRGYLSYSQKALWKSCPERYIKQYMLGAEGFTNQAMVFGKMIAEELEKDESEDAMIDLLKLSIPTYKEKEFVLEATLIAGKDKVALKGVFDSFDPIDKKIIEYKTGTQKWTQARADKHAQLLFYAVMCWFQFKMIPQFKLVWIKTEKKYGKTDFTGEVETFEVRYKLQDIINEACDILTVAKEISAEYEKQLSII